MNLKNLFGALLMGLLVISLSSCEGPEGPVGAAGAAGPAGTNGIDGQDAGTTCTDCHGSSQLITAKLHQWENSVHATGGNYERNYASCAGCHTSQGFLEVLESGEYQAAAGIDDPLPQNCYACHQIHQTYTDADWELTSRDPVTFWVGGETADVGSGNLCLKCHQARIPTPGIPAVGEDETYEITNKRYGPHHGSQGVVFTGATAYEIGEGYENSSHTTLIADACVTCHMAPVMGGDEAGGHTFRVTSEEGELNTAGCIACHTDAGALETKVEETQAEIAGLLLQLGDDMRALGIIGDDDYAIVPQDMSSLRVGILWNYKYVLEDRSLGVHNYKYVKTLLENSIAGLE
jgi:hypothetical protein